MKPKNKAAVELGSRGGSAGTSAQTEARRANIAKTNAARIIHDEWTDSPLTKQQRYLRRKAARKVKGKK